MSSPAHSHQLRSIDRPLDPAEPLPHPRPRHPRERLSRSNSTSLRYGYLTHRPRSRVRRTLVMNPDNTVLTTTLATTPSVPTTSTSLPTSVTAASTNISSTTHSVGSPVSSSSVQPPVSSSSAQQPVSTPLVQPPTMSSSTQQPNAMVDLTNALRCLRTSPTMAPRPFEGVSDNVDDWLDDFDLYCSLLRITSDDEKLPLLTAFLDGMAKHWLKTLPAHIRASYPDLRLALTNRFQRTQFQINTQRSFIYQLRQEPGELFPAFVLRVQKAARGLNIQPDDVLAICLQGADSRIQPYLLMARPTTIDELLSLPVVAESTIESKLVSDDISSVRMLSAKLDNIQDAIISKSTTVRFADDTPQRSRSLSPARAKPSGQQYVTPLTPPTRRMADNRPSRPTQRQFIPRDRPSFRPPSRDRFRSTARNKSDNDAVYHRSSNRRSPSRQNSCGRCSYSHDGRSCPAVSQRCNFCNNIGHFSSVCRKRSNRNSSR